MTQVKSANFSLPKRCLKTSLLVALGFAALSSLAQDSGNEDSARFPVFPEKLSSFLTSAFSLEISHRESESAVEKPQFDPDYDGVSVRVSSVLRRIVPSDDMVTRVLVHGGIASKGALAFGGLRVGYGQIFLPESVVDTGRTGTAWESPGYFQIKTCFNF